MSWGENSQGLWLTIGWPVALTREKRDELQPELFTSIFESHLPVPQRTPAQDTKVRMLFECCTQLHLNVWHTSKAPVWPWAGIGSPRCRHLRQFVQTASPSIERWWRWRWRCFANCQMALKLQFHHFFIDRNYGDLKFPNVSQYPVLLNLQWNVS